MKNIVVFGTGKYFENYMAFYGLDKKPLFAVDNDSSKHGQILYGVEICSPDRLKTLLEGSFYVIICLKDSAAVSEQLKEMGIYDYQPYKIMADGELYSLPEELKKKPKHAVGYVPGAFDLFHIGHLNLLHKSKLRCEYLIAGVLTDELIIHFKHRPPVIPYTQRAAIVGAISYVDRVVPVDFTNTRKIDAWRMYHYNCHFSGNDHGPDWELDKRELQEVGAEMEFFEYTRATSSTAIKKNLAAGAYIQNMEQK